MTPRLQLESDLRAAQAEAKTLLGDTMQRCEAHVNADASTGRLMSAEEKQAIQAAVDKGAAIKARLEGLDNGDKMQRAIAELTAHMSPAPTDVSPQQSHRLSLGAQFIADPKYRDFIKAGGHRRAGSWASPEVDVLQMRATTLDTTSGSGGQLIIPDTQPGVTPLLFKRLTIRDLLAPGSTMGNLIQYMKETTFTNAAAAVAQAGTKPESTLVYAAVTSPVQKIAHWIPVTEEMLEDYAQTASLIDARLTLGLALVEEDELLNGSGVTPHLLGLMNLAGLTAAQARGADSSADAIFKQITTIGTTVFVQPDGIVMNPTNWQTVQLSKNAMGQYFGAGPWAPAQMATLWGLPVAVTPSIVANTALVGAFKQCAQIFDRSGLRIEASNSHASFFVTNMVAIRAEERLAVVSYRDAAFGKVTGLN